MTALLAGGGSPDNLLTDINIYKIPAGKLIFAKFT